MIPLRKMQSAGRRRAIDPKATRRRVHRAIRIAREIKVRSHIGANAAYSVLRKKLPPKIEAADGADYASFPLV